MKFLNLQTDFAFKRVFGNAKKPHIAINFLNAVLALPEGKEIVDLIFIDPYNKPKTTRKKLGIVDVKCTNKRGEKFIIEMQAREQPAYAKRAQHYVFANVVDQLEKGERFDTLLPVYFVGVLKFNLITHTKQPISRYTIVQKQNDELLEDDLMDLANWTFIELTKFNKKIAACKTLVEQWMYLLKYAEKLDEIPALLGAEKALLEAMELLNEGAMTEKERVTYQEELDALRVEEDILSAAEKKAEARGKTEGKTEGKAEAIRELARNLLDVLPVEKIAEITGLSADEIKKLP